jgi:outer membrane protein OmpA-like peptidoglycan-associated protein
MYEAKQEAFPAPRKNNWSIGIQGGPAYISGDIRADRGLGFGLNIRKALGHTFSLRLQGATGYARGLNWRPNASYFFNSGLNGNNDPNVNYLTLPYDYVFYNYQMRFYDANLQGVVNIGNISFYNKQPKLSFYAFAGVGGMMYITELDALDETGSMYDYSGITAGQNLDTKKDVLNSLRNLLDGEYETMAEEHPHKQQFKGRTLVPAATVGGGVALRLSRRVDLSLETRATWSGDDLIDGHRWEETNTLTSNSDILQFTTLGINFKIGKGEESNWWRNPLTQVYSDVRDLKRFNNKDEKDSDNDGVVDRRDKEPGTPEGVMVDAQGRAVDSDGDGIQDFRDKEPFSPKGAQVDRAGVSVDSDADGVIDFYDQEPNTAAGVQADANGKAIQGLQTAAPKAIPLLPIVNFDLGKSEIKEEYIEALYTVAKLLTDYPDIRLRVIGNADVRGTSKKNEELSKDRANAVVNMLVRGFGISRDRFDIDFKGSNNLLVKDITAKSTKENEQLHFLNRRVEFEIVK